MKYLLIFMTFLIGIGISRPSLAIEAGEDGYKFNYKTEGVERIFILIVEKDDPRSNQISRLVRVAGWLPEASAVNGRYFNLPALPFNQVYIVGYFESITYWQVNAIAQCKKEYPDYKALGICKAETRIFGGCKIPKVYALPTDRTKLVYLPTILVDSDIQIAKIQYKPAETKRMRPTQGIRATTSSEHLLQTIDGLCNQDPTDSIEIPNAGNQVVSMDKN